MTITFTVCGKPATAGSKKAYAFKRKDGSLGANVTADDPKALLWRNAVAVAAHEAYDGPLLTGPIHLIVTFGFPRPKGHFGKGRNAARLKPSAPDEHIQKPDLVKLVRAVEDSLKGVVWRDDSQVCQHQTRKRWDERYCTAVTIKPIESNCGPSAEGESDAKTTQAAGSRV